MLKVFNDSYRKFQLEANGEKVMLYPGRFYDLKDEFQADTTFRLAVRGGELKVYDDAKAAEKLIQAHEERVPEEPKAPVTIENADEKPAEKPGKAKK